MSPGKSRSTGAKSAGVADGCPGCAGPVCDSTANPSARPAGSVCGGSEASLELAGLVRDIGPDRVLLGSDYPWYEPAHSAELVEDLPLLSRAEKDAILGENAARILRLPV